MMMNPPGWRDYQKNLKRNTALKRRLLQAGKLIIAFVVFSSLIYGAVAGLTGMIRYFQKSDFLEASAGKEGQTGSPEELLNKNGVQSFLDQSEFINLDHKELKIAENGTDYTVVTTLDPELQAFIQQKLDVKNSRYIGIVTLDPDSGKVLSMVSLDKTNPNGNPCVDKPFPAASIFKIIAAAAAIETCHFNENKKFSYNGQKHTLYKSQLKEQTNRYTSWITFEQAFAKSVNPVFGKIGFHYLGKGPLVKYAAEFGFNEPISFELPLPSSEMFISDKPYNWAEVASGFNHKTTLTPIHGALIAGAILNGGKLMEPYVVERIFTKDGQMVYEGQPISIKQAVTDETSKIIRNLMKATVDTGTLKKSFRGYTRDSILSKLSIGGKTGSIDTDNHEVRLDWFVGYADEKNGSARIVVSVLVAHEKFIGIRAGQYARMVMKEYFKNYFASQQEQDSEKDMNS